MAQTWQQSYEQLKKFIADHPAIEIDMNSIVISGDLRPEFYKLFDTVRVSFIKERFAAELEKAYALSAAYSEAGRAVKEELKLEDIEINANLNWFLLDPINGLMRVLFDPQFDLLKGKTDLSGFVEVADTSVATFFKLLFREGYERWGALALLRLLAPDRLWMVKAHDFYTDPSMEGDVIEGNHDDFVPDPVESRKLVFDNMVRASFVVPGALVHSAPSECLCEPAAALVSAALEIAPVERASGVDGSQKDIQRVRHGQPVAGHDAACDRRAP